MGHMRPLLWSAAAIAGTSFVVVQVGSGDAFASRRAVTPVSSGALTPASSRAGTAESSRVLTLESSRALTSAPSPALTRAGSAKKSTSLQDTSPLELVTLKKTADSLFGAQQYERALPILRRVVQGDENDPSITTKLYG